MKRIALILLATIVCQALAAQVKLDSTAVVGNIPTANYNQPAKKYVISDVKISGVKYLTPEILVSSTGFNKGDTVLIPSDYISDGIKKLWNQRYFSDVKVVTEMLGGDSVRLVIHLAERPRVYKWLFEGVRRGEASNLLEDLKLRRGSELSDFAIKNATDLIKKHYHEKGFRNVEVDIRQENDTMIKNAVNVTFVVKKNTKVKIGEIIFEGNKAFSEKRLKGSGFKKTKEKTLRNFFKSSRLNVKEYEEDKENLIDFYNSKGYRNASIVSDSIYEINNRRIGIKVNVDEGNKYYYRNISWMGNSKFETEALDAMVGINKGDPYDRKTMLKRLGIDKESTPDDMSVTSLYQNDGHLFFQVEPAETIIGEDSIDVQFKVFEGKQARINEVSITGNQRVNDEVIRRELYVRPGELYNRSLLMSTIRQLSQMSHFNPEALQPGIDPINSELVNISFPLEEQASDRFELSGGWGADMFVGSVGIQLNNVSLKNFFKKGEWRPYPAGQNQQLAIRGQTNGSYYKSLSVNFVEPWLGGKKPNSLNVGIYFSDESNAYYFYQSGTKHFRTIGASVGIGRRLSWPDQYFTLYNEIGYQMYNLKDWDYFIINNGSSNIFTIKTVFGRNSVDQPIYPRRGSDFSIALTLTPPYSLFDGKDYSDKKLSDEDRYRWIEYHKWQFKGQWYYPISRNQNLVLMAKAEMAALGSYNKDKPSPFEGFDVGGDGMSGYNVYGVDVIGLRGYENSAVNPANNNGDYARVYNKYTVELRYPFILKPSSTIYGLVFAEGGNAYASWKKFSPFTLKRSLGAGVRMYLPIVGMIGIDWGYGFDRPTYGSQKSGSQFHFMMGTQF